LVSLGIIQSQNGILMDNYVESVGTPWMCPKIEI